MSIGSDEERARALQDFLLHGTAASRDNALEAFLPLADYFARRYAQRSVELDDLRQVARVGLVKSIDRFDPSVGATFATFAGRTIDGELKHWFRDKSWAVRVPRSIKENALAVGVAQRKLEQKLGRAPTAREICESTGLELDHVLEALDAKANYQPVRLDRPAASSEDAPLGHTLADATSAIETRDLEMLVEAVINELPDAEAAMVRLRFFDEMSQSQIADRLDISQMQVSRVLRRVLGELQVTLSEQSD